MIHLRLRTEYNFRRAFGPVEKVVAYLKETKATAAGIADIGCWGHVNFFKECKAAGIKPLLGAEIAVVDSVKERTKQPPNFMAFIAKNNEGLREIYELVSTSTDEQHYYYFPRIDYDEVAALSDNVVVLSGISPNLNRLQPRSNLFFELSYLTPLPNALWAQDKGIQCVATIDNYYIRATDKASYDILLGKDRNSRIFPMHITDQYLLQHHRPFITQEHVDNAQKIADMCNVELPQAELVHYPCDKTLEQICREAAKRRLVDLSNPVYEARLRREIDLISDKKFDDYFYVLWDLMKYAKQHMLVGPARGSSCGSLVCYLLEITEIDPIPYDLIFERFIDINRKDLPDVDIDFADDRRDLVFKYIADKYGQDCVARVGTILRFKAKSAIGTTAKELFVPEFEVNDLKDKIIERSGGDSRAKFCIMDTFNELEIGREVLKKYPRLRYAQFLEMHAHYSGQHAAGVVVTNKPLTNYCAVDRKVGALQVDKIDAEKINLLKIDALGLRTLSILQDTIDQIGKSREWLMRLPTDDKKAFEVLNSRRFSGIFQFEGFALQSLAGQMTVEYLEDIISITALARPGPINSGAATEFILRRTGQHEVEYLHPMVEPLTKVTYGTIIYQEQVMQIGREVGRLSWEDVSSLRKAMSKSLGEEFFNKYWDKFKVGAAEQGIDEAQARSIWNHINTMGSWSFNRSHAVAYGMVSYWCCYLKAHFPLEFAAANLRYAKDDQQAVWLLRELVREGYEYVPFDKDVSKENWSIHEGKLVGGFMGLKGCGKSKAADMVRRRKNGEPYLPGQVKMIMESNTPWNDIFECNTRWGHIRREPEKYKILTRMVDIRDIDENSTESICFICKLKEKNLRDLNEAQKLAKRGGKKVDTNNLWLNIVVEDDTGQMMCSIDRFKFAEIGRPIVEKMVEGKDWLIIKGRIRGKGFRLVAVEAYRHLTAVKD